MRLLVLCFACAWFGVLVPVHNRGQILLPGARAAAAVPPSGHDCCPTPAGRTESPDSGHGCNLPCGESAPGNAAACAVCHFITGLDTPPPVTFVSARLRYAGRCAVPALPATPDADPRLPFNSRAPPAA